MKAMWGNALRAALVTAVTAAGVALPYLPAQADDSAFAVTITDRRGAPEDLLQRLERQTGQPVGALDTVIAVDTAGQRLTIDQFAALVAGQEVAGARVLGVMPGREIAGATMADLADGTYDGRGGATATSTIVFASSIPESREWCLTMCMASGKTVWECILARLGRSEW
ncbi:hypothetical protein Rhe02_36230 [Rhizocola hellebori]|uniref:Uncharacterized protein n=1 Tax=Rhizocola hellebori TaxID=1392758 RepID=A0A8J3Q9E3_9ACTN|nr:hypothetical protein [Rhizocola hellebori]GIH05556.1 hypothetical protein Rhe02_36230 [Rhizocola hellebori]